MSFIRSPLTENLVDQLGAFHIAGQSGCIEEVEKIRVGELAQLFLFSGHASDRFQFGPRPLERVGEHLLPGHRALRVLLDRNRQLGRREPVAIGAVLEMLGARVAGVSEPLPLLDAEGEEVGFEVHGPITPNSVTKVKHFLVSRPCCTPEMNDDALIRLENLKATKLSAKELSDRAGGRVSYWSDMLRGKKSFGEKAARNLEERLGLPRLAMDAPLDDDAGSTKLVPAQVALPDPDGVTTALEVLAEALRSTDKATRSAVAPLLSLLATEPEQIGNILAAVNKLLPDQKLARASRDDQPAGFTISGLPSGGLKPNEQRDRVQAPRQVKR